MTITKKELEQLKKLKQKADKLQDEIDKLHLKALEITKERDQGGKTFDYMLNDFYTEDEFLDALNITVVE